MKKTPPQKLDQMRSYYQRNRERVIQRVREYEQKNAEQVRMRRKCYQLRHRDKLAAYYKEWRTNNKHMQPEWNRRSRERQQQARIEVLNRYGGKCVCCGECDPRFLAFDHMNGGGKKHLRSITVSIFYWLKRNGFPSGFQVLCHNCNMAKGFYGECPHKSETRIMLRRSLMRVV